MATHKDDETISDELQTLRRIEELLALMARTMLADQMNEIMSNKGHRTLYEATGRIPVRQLAKKTGLAVGTISGLWKKWEQSGLIVKEGKQYRKVL